MNSALLRAFCDAYGPLPAIEEARVDAALAFALEEARKAHPSVRLEDGAFAAHLGRLFAGHEATGAEISARFTSDIFLACACVSGDDAAIATFDQQVLATLPGAMARLKLGSGAVEEAVQRAREKLLVGNEGTGKLVDFAGTGDLRGWVKVIAIRDALRVNRKDKREVSLSDELEAALPAGGLDPDLEYQRRLYRAEFKESFEAAVDELEARERSLLRQAIVYHSTVDQIAIVYQVHRATAARWVAKARDELASKTRHHLRKRLQLSDSQFQSVVRLIESQMDLSIERLLATADGDEGKAEPEG